MIRTLGLFAAIFLTACQTGSGVSEQEAQQAAASAALAASLAAQPEEVRARYDERHPQATIEYFGIQPGMTVAEALPGGGWYTKILLQYLGEEGTLLGADYPVSLYSNFGFMTPERLKAKETWVTDWPAGAREWGVSNGAAVDGFVLGDLPETMQGSADVVLFVRALHNMARFSGNVDYLGQAIADAHAVLKPGGIAGVVQHQGAEEMSDEWASGKNGYLKKSFVIAQFEANGFELLGDSDINSNAKDQPTADDFVWRLPPSLRTSSDNPELMEALKAVGESNRMTLKFRKN
ncbi:MAG: class I SAM-dependent methyltransferase [Pseudomonadales bacterium]